MTLLRQGFLLPRYPIYPKDPMNFTICKGKHRAWPFSLGLYWKPKTIERLVSFDESCRYDLQDVDQMDTNKLFGIGFFPFHHKESARFGWRYDLEKKNIVISAYCYVNRQRVMEDLCTVEIGEQVPMQIMFDEGSYYFNVVGKAKKTIPHANVSRLGYALGLFFGGNKPAPQKITVNISWL